MQQTDFSYTAEHHLHTQVFMPRGCKECFPGGAPPLPPLPPQQASERALPHTVTVPLGQPGMHTLGEAMAPAQAKLRSMTFPPARPDYDLPEDGLPVCGSCNSLRWVRPEGWTPNLPLSDPRIGQMVPCPDCSAGRIVQKRIDRYWRHAGLKLRSYTLEGLAACSPKHAAFIAKLRRWLALPDAPSLYLCGPWGCGKTGAAAGLAREVMASGGTALLAVAPEMLGWLKATYKGDGDEEVVLNDLRNCDLLVLDDLGKQQQTDWAADRIFQVLNYRYNHNRRIIITTNETPFELGKRLNMHAEMSRIREMAGRGEWVIDCSDLPNLRELPA